MTQHSPTEVIDLVSSDEETDATVIDLVSSDEETDNATVDLVSDEDEDLGSNMDDDEDDDSFIDDSDLTEDTLTHGSDDEEDTDDDEYKIHEPAIKRMKIAQNISDETQLDFNLAVPPDTLWTKFLQHIDKKFPTSSIRDEWSVTQGGK
jgi:hypothetical protein